MARHCTTCDVDTERYGDGSCKPCRRASNKRWKARNPGTVKAGQIRNYRRHGAERRQRRAVYLREYGKQWREAHREEIALYMRQWAVENPDKIRERNSTRRGRLAQAFVEAVNPFVVYERDGGLCGICGELATKDAFHVDHIVPLKVGGEHSYANAQVAHPTCNIRKGASYAA